MVRKEHLCRFCGVMCEYCKTTKRVYETGTRKLHIENCPKRARHYHELAMDDAEEARQKRRGDHNRTGTETPEGRKFTDALEMLTWVSEEEMDL